MDELFMDWTDIKAQIKIISDLVSLNLRKDYLYAW